MSPHTHITIVGLVLLALYAGFIMWTLYRLNKMTAYIHLIEDFVKFNAELVMAKDNPQKMMDLYDEYQQKVEA